MWQAPFKAKAAAPGISSLGQDSRAYDFYAICVLYADGLRRAYGLIIIPL